MKKRMVSLLMAVALVLTMLPVTATVAQAATISSYEPYVKIETGYSATVSYGTIRYMSQIPGSQYFYSDYWGNWAGQAKIECGTCCISMALSYVGVNKTPDNILDAGNGTTYFGSQWGGVAVCSYTGSDIKTAVARYVDGNGKYSPPIIHLNNYSSAGHFVVVVGRISDSEYQVVDPGNSVVSWTITISGTSATYTHPKTGGYISDSIDRSGRTDDIYQYYNENASIEKLTVTVYFEPNAGIVDTTQETISVGSEIGRLPIPERNGYKFAGWYVSENSVDDPVTSSTTFSEDTTLYAHWIKVNDKGNKITLEPNGGELPGADLVRTIDGFNTARREQQLVVYNCEGSLVATNYWGYEVAVDSFNRVTDKRNYGEDRYLTVPGGGFVLSGHTMGDDSGGGFVHNISVGDYVAYDEDAMQVSWYTTSNAYLTEQKYVLDDSPYGTLPTPTHPELEFAGWYTEPSGGTRVTEATLYCASTLYAHWGCQHDYTVTVIPATCLDYEQLCYTCNECGDSYTTYADEIHSQWSETKPSSVPENLIETKVQYRYSDYDTKTSYEPSLDGYNLLSSTWEQSGMGTVEHVKSWPSGFSTGHGLYSTYNKATKAASETSTDKVTINSDKITGYLYYHWCRGTYNEGPINRGAKAVQGGEFNSFHAFYSTTSPSGLTPAASGDGSYTYGNGDCCRDSYWYFYVPVYSQSYTTYRNLFTHGRWSSWSSWEDSVYNETSSRKVETRTVYRYVNAQLGDHNWDDGSVTTAASCTQTGEKTYTCTACGNTKTETVAKLNHDYQSGYCTNCGEQDPDYVFAKVGVQVGTVEAEPGDTVTVPVCLAENTGFAGFTFIISYSDADLTLVDIKKGDLLKTSDAGAFVKNVDGGTVTWYDIQNIYGDGELFLLTFEVASQIRSGDYTVSVSLKDEKATNFVDENSRAVKVQFETGAVQITVCTHDEMNFIPGYAPGCTTDGNAPYYVCTSCGQMLKEDGITETTKDAEILPATNHSYDYAISQSPTVSMTGTLSGICSKCSDTTVVTLPKLNTVEYTYAVKRAATCTAEGVASYTWKTTVYGEFSFGVTLPILGHSYENGSCAICGASDPNYIPGATKPTLTLKSPTLEFKDMICINAFYTADNTQDVVEMGMITYDEKVTSLSVDTADHVIPGATYNADTGRYVSRSQGIHAKYLGDTIYLAVYAKLKDGSYAYSKLAPYSAVTYAANQLKNSTDVNLKKLVAAMLNYGAEAQLYFGHNTGNLANAALTADQKALPDTYRADMINSVPAASAAKQGIFANNSGFASRKPAISFEGAFCINYFFTPKYTPTGGITLYYWNEADYNAKDVLTTSNATGKIKLDGSGTGEYRGDITGIAAKNLAGAAYVAAAYKDSSGTVWTSGVLGYSIGAYCGSQISKGTAVAALAEATAVYGYHAKTYFG